MTGGGRPLVGYYLEFDMGMLNKYVRPLIGAPLPNRRIEVSSLYYDWRARQVPPGGNIDQLETRVAGMGGEVGNRQQTAFGRPRGMGI